MKTKADSHKGLNSLHQDAGAPQTMVVNNAKEENLGEFKKSTSKHGTHLKSTEPYSPWQQAAEGKGSA